MYTKKPWTNLAGAFHFYPHHSAVDTTLLVTLSRVIPGIFIFLNSPQRSYGAIERRLVNFGQAGHPAQTK